MEDMDGRNDDTPAECWDGLSGAPRYAAIAAITFGVGLSVLDGTVANVALPSIAADLGVSAADSIWVVNSYQLATVISLLSLSALGDMAGYRRVYLAGLCVFLFGSVWCMACGSLASLIAARVVQGFGSAALASVNTSLIRVIYPKRLLGRGMGINAMVVALSSVAGPSVAAAVLSVASWPWIFAVNIPVCLSALVLSFRYLPPNPERRHAASLDWRSGILNALTFGLFIASVEGYAHGVGGAMIAVMAAASLFAGRMLWRRQRGQEYPLLPVDLLRIPIFTLSICTSICSFLAQMLAMVSLPFFLQVKMGYDEASCGLLLTAWPAAVMLTAPLAGRLVEKVHAGILGGAGLAVFSAGLFSLYLMPSSAEWGNIAWRLAVCGVGFALFQSPNNSIIIASSPQRRSGSASGMMATARLLGQSCGAACVALLFHLFPQQGTDMCLVMAGCVAAAACVLSLSRISMPLPESLRSGA